MIESSIHNQTQDYLQRNELLYIYQLGFRTNHSTDRCLSRLTDMILNSTENGRHTGMILIDLQKAFDTLDHNILEKMNDIGTLEVLFSIHWTMCFRKQGLQSSSKINITTFIVFAIKTIFHKPCQIVTHTCMWTTIALCANGLLIISFQFIVVKIKLIAFFSVKKETLRSLT